MSRNTTRGGVIAAIAAVTLTSAGVAAPAAFADDRIDGDVSVSNTETVQVLMDAAGRIDAQRVYEQLVLRGNGKVDIANPISAKGLRNLDGFGGFEVQDGKQRIATDVDGTKKFRTVSDHTKKLPIDIDITYTLDGKKVDPGDIVGKSGDLEVQYVVTNTTGQTEDVPYKDGNGDEKTASEKVVVPMVGSLTTVLPSTFTKVQSDEANAAGDGRGGTQLSFTMTLIPPIGKATAEFGYRARISDGVVPKASVSVLPVNPLDSPSFKGGAASYKGGAETGQDLTAGATEIDANVLKLRDGANDLVTGILQLADGANQLSAGLNGEAAPGAKKLDAGAGKLAAGLSKAESGSPALIKGVQDLAAGAKKVDNGLIALKAGVADGADTFQATFNGSVDGIIGTLSASLGGIIQAYLDPALGEVTANANLTPEEKGSLQTKIGTAKGGLQQVQAKLTSEIAPGLKGGVAGGLKQVKDGVAAGVGSPTAKDTLRNGLAQLMGGLDTLETKGGGLVDGIGELSAGASELKAGTGQLSSGLGDAASGSGELAAGLGTAAEGAPELPKGADRLSKEGTSQLIEAGNATAMDYGLKYALIEAGAARAGSAQPYGSPEGATALTAYKFEIAGENGAGSANMKRGLAAIVLLAGAAAFTTARRRGLI